MKRREREREGERKRETKWEREREEHIEYAHTPGMLKKLLEDAGFTDVQFRCDAPQGDAGRLFIVTKR